MDRKCHTNTCPVGIATQDPARRAKFAGTKDQLITYFRFVAEDTRRHLADMGFRSIGEIVGRADLIKKKETGCVRADMLDISRMTEVVDGTQSFSEGQPDVLGDVLDKRIIRDAFAVIDCGSKAKLEYSICNVDRSVGAMLSGAIVRRGGIHRKSSMNVSFVGTAGQSFGAFLVEGVSFTLDGEANDYVGKGLSGGRISIRPQTDMPYGSVIAGNTIMYGATSGELYANGSVGERFCVRNSGATAVCEGAGDHCCEYMTGGRVVVLGNSGRNFAAGMSGGIAYVLNDGEFDRHCNMDMVELSLVDDPRDVKELRSIIEKHLEFTGSPKAKEILGDWDEWVKRFLKVTPTGYRDLVAKSR